MQSPNRADPGHTSNLYLRTDNPRRYASPSQNVGSYWDLAVPEDLYSVYPLDDLLVNPQICLCNWRVKVQLVFIRLVFSDMCIRFHSDQSSFQRHFQQILRELLFLAVFLISRSQSSEVCMSELITYYWSLRTHDASELSPGNMQAFS